MLAKRGVIVAQAVYLCFNGAMMAVAIAMHDRASGLSNNGSSFQEHTSVMPQQDSNEQRSRSNRAASSTRASDRVSAQRKKTNRMLRTIFLGTVAMVGGVFWLGDQYGVDRAETINLLVSSAGFVVLLAMAGLAGAGCIWLVRRLFSQRK